MPSSHAALTGVCIHHVPEWYRVLHIGGLLLLSVPNLETLSRYVSLLRSSSPDSPPSSTPHHHCTHLSPFLPCSMYLDPALTTDDRWHVTRMIYGSQTDSFDFHKVDCLLHSLCIIYLLPSEHHPSALLCIGGIRRGDTEHIPVEGGLLQDREGGVVQHALPRHLGPGVPRALRVSEHRCEGVLRRAAVRDGRLQAPPLAERSRRCQPPSRPLQRAMNTDRYTVALHAATYCDLPREH